MNVSLRRRLSAWLTISILAAALPAAGISFLHAYDDANELQDTQLRQVAGVLANGLASKDMRKQAPRAEDEPEDRYVIEILGAPPEASGSPDLSLPESLPPGLQTIVQADISWRVFVARDTAGNRFAVAQRMMVRDEFAQDAALFALMPLVVIVPLLLLIVAAVLRRGFAPMSDLSSSVDQLDGRKLAALDERHVPLEALPFLQAINRLMHRLGTALEQQRDFISDAAHELRTPVAALIVQAENVRHASLSVEANERMVVLRQGLSRMSSLIDQLLSLARTQGSMQAPAEAIDMDALVRSAFEESLPMAQARGVDLGCPRLDRAPIRGDPLHAYALVRNAIDNAVRYTPAAGAVDVSIRVEARELCFTVEDTGPGIREVDLERVFEPFVRVLGSGEPGSGLGLAIVRAASRALGGDVSIANRDDRPSGLRFSYRQPLA